MLRFAIATILLLLASPAWAQWGTPQITRPTITQCTTTLITVGCWYTTSKAALGAPDVTYAGGLPKVVPGNSSLASYLEGGDWAFYTGFSRIFSHYIQIRTENGATICIDTNVETAVEGTGEVDVVFIHAHAGDIPSGPLYNPAHLVGPMHKLATLNTATPCVYSAPSGIYGLMNFTDDLAFIEMVSINVN